jgi:hypothetical protein
MLQECLQSPCQGLLHDVCSTGTTPAPQPRTCPPHSPGGSTKQLPGVVAITAEMPERRLVKVLMVLLYGSLSMVASLR